MNTPSPAKPRRSPVIWAFVIALVAGATLAPAAAFEFKSLFKRKQLDAREISIDTGEAVRMLSDYRKSHGVGSLRLDPTLTRIAASHALRMAATDRLSHVARGERSFARRLRDGGFDAAVASENIGGGYKTLAEALAGWKRSREHNKNMLRPDVTLMGIARADATGSKYGTYWSLVLARPYERPPGPSSGSIAPPGLIFGRYIRARTHQSVVASMAASSPFGTFDKAVRAGTLGGKRTFAASCRHDRSSQKCDVNVEGIDL